MNEFPDEIEDSGMNYYNRILIGTATTGLVRVEWVQSRYGQLIPVNWTSVSFVEPIAGYYPLRYLVADAQNIICHVAIERDFEWILLWEQDTYPDSPDALMKLNEYMISREVPVVSGLYYTKSVQSQPLIFRGRGGGVYLDWKKGDKVWCDGVPTGFLLIHTSIIHEMAKDVETYSLRGTNIKRIFVTPREYFHEDRGELNTISGTSDLDWCTRVMKGGYFKKAGWGDLQKKRYPFLVDTNINCKHINPDGEQFP